MWHVSSRSGVATLRTAIHLLLTCYYVGKIFRVVRIHWLPTQCYSWVGLGNCPPCPLGSRASVLERKSHEHRKVTGVSHEPASLAALSRATGSTGVDVYVCQHDVIRRPAHLLAVA